MGPVDFSAFAGQTFSFNVPGGSGQVWVNYSLCGNLNGMSCGIFADNKCAKQDSNCCAVCESWPEEDGLIAGACLGTDNGCGFLRCLGFSL